MNSQDELINKIRNIVRLARRAGTDGERAAAEAAAKRLADKHGIALETLEETAAEIVTDAFVDDGFSTLPTLEAGYITSILREHFGIILIQQRVRGTQKARLTWIGTAINVDIAKHVYVVLLRACRKDWGEVRIAKRNAKATAITSRTTSADRHALVQLRNLSQKSFYDGWYSAIHRKLIENPLRNDIEQYNAEKKAAENKFRQMQEQMNINEERRNRKLDRIDMLSAQIGMACGSKINLNRPCDAGGYTGPVPQIA